MHEALDVRVADRADRSPLRAVTTAPDREQSGALQPSAPRRGWQQQYVRRLVTGDVVVGALAAIVGYLLRFGASASIVEATPASVWLAVVFPLAWVSAMFMGRTYERRFLWVGPEEFRRVTSSAVALLAAVGTVSWALKLEFARGLIITTLPLAALVTLLHRWLQRRWLRRRREQGLFQQTTLLVGHLSGVRQLHAQMRRDGSHGHRVIGYCVAGGWGQHTASSADVPVLGTIEDVADVAREHDVDIVALLPCPELEGPALRRLGWELEATQADLLLAPAITEIAGPRVNIRPVSGLPLLHVDHPEFSGFRRLLKASLDRTAAAFAVVLSLPLLLVIAAAIRWTDGGPVLFRQERVGRDGRTFQMLKFRSMLVGADRMTESLRERNDGNGVLFKLREDPRVTRVGRLLRRYSLDELPQLFNVLRGDMSLVGPRPPLPSEVARYGVDMHRRFVVKPGLTGLWQVSGRSDLSWDASVQVDIQYVENWSLAFDMMILWKTIGAVVRGSGAY